MAPRALSALVALAIVGGALTGCMPDAEPEPTAPFATEAEAFAAAEATYRAYVDALNQVDLADPETFEAVYAWTTGTQNASDREGLTGYHADSVEVSGESLIVLSEGLSTDDDAREVELAVCLDVSNVDVVDADGESLVDPDRVDVQTLLVVLVASTGSPTGMLVKSIDGRSGEPTCE